MIFDIEDQELENMGMTRDEWDNYAMECETCRGNGGWDISDDCEVYDDWRECLECGGEGWIEK